MSRRAAALASLVLLVGAAGPAAAQVDLTVEPAMTRGPERAPVTIVAFFDFECLACKRVQRSVDEILKEYDGRVRLVAKDLPLNAHPQARQAAEAARCAGAAGQYWPYHDRLFEAQPRFSDERLVAYAAEVGLDREAFGRCLGERRFARAVDDDLKQARALGIGTTPTFLINGRVLVGAHTTQTFREVIDEVLLRRGVSREGRR